MWCHALLVMCRFLSYLGFPFLVLLLHLFWCEIYINAEFCTFEISKLPYIMLSLFLESRIVHSAGWFQLWFHFSPCLFSVLQKLVTISRQNDKMFQLPGSMKEGFPRTLCDPSNYHILFPFACCRIRLGGRSCVYCLGVGWGSCKAAEFVLVGGCAMHFGLTLLLGFQFLYFMLLFLVPQLGKLLV